MVAPPEVAGYSTRAACDASRRASTWASSAALKVLLAFLLRAENKAIGKAGPNQGSVSFSYDQLMSLAHLSRAMVSAAVKLLQSVGIVSVKKQGGSRKNCYFWNAYGDA